MTDAGCGPPCRRCLQRSTACTTLCGAKLFPVCSPARSSRSRTTHPEHTMSAVRLFRTGGRCEACEAFHCRVNVNALLPTTVPTLFDVPDIVAKLPGSRSRVTPASSILVAGRPRQRGAGAPCLPGREVQIPQHALVGVLLGRGVAVRDPTSRCRSLTTNIGPGTVSFASDITS
jgi:hypothetical protein